MQSESPSSYQGQIAVFYQRHRTELLTLLFTDLVESTALKQQVGDQTGATLIQQHRHLIREILRAFPDGEEIETAGDSFLLIFAKPSEAVKFALTVQARMRPLSQEAGRPVRVRLGIHIGEVVIEEHRQSAKPKDLCGVQVDMCARVMSLAQGGQILMTRAVFDNARQVLKGEDLEGIGPLGWMSHGPYLLKGVEEPVEVCEVRMESAGPTAAPPSAEKARRYAGPEEEAVLGWRPAVGLVVPGTHWVLETKLGEGGFGEVWLVRHRKLKEERVLKFCFRADRVRALKREMTLFRVLRERVGEQRHLVKLLEVHLEQPPYYLEEEYVTGRDLRTWCESQGGIGQVPLAVRLEMVAQAAEGLAAAHAAGITHRDVKPGNILVQSRRRGDEALTSAPGEAMGKNEPPDVGSYEVVVKLTDFGIGQVISQEFLAGITVTGLTGTIMAKTSSGASGTQMYMAPELLEGKPASVRSDLYSLGVVWYQLLVGDFGRAVTMDWAHDISEPLLKEDLKRCFAGKPEERFASAGELAKNLRSLEARRALFAKQEEARVAATREAFERGAVKVASLAVLPFANMSADPENEFLSDGIAEDLITALSRVQGLRVPARTSAFAFKGKTQDIRLIGQMLSVETVLEGSVRKAGNRLRVTTQLINVADGFHLWSERYDREMQDVFAIQDEITQTIVEALKERLGGGPGPAPFKHYTANAETYQLYLKGRFCIAKVTPEGLGMGMRLLEEALNLEPNYPLPYVTLAQAWWCLAHFGVVRPKEGMPKSQTAALRALKLDDTLAEAHTQLALTRFMYDWDWPGAEQAFRRALALDPKNAEAHHWYGIFLWAMARNEEALAEEKKAVELDPLSLIINMDLAFPLLSLGRAEEALAHADKLVSLEPNFWGGYRVRGFAEVVCGKISEAIADLEKAVALGGGPFMLGPLGAVLAMNGRGADAQRVLDELNRLARERYIPPGSWVIIYAGLGDREQLLAWWDKAMQERDGVLAALGAAAKTFLRQNSDLRVLLKQIGL